MTHFAAKGPTSRRRAWWAWRGVAGVAGVAGAAGEAGEVGHRPEKGFSAKTEPVD